MSKLKNLLQWYRQPAGLVWLAASVAIIAGTLFALRPLIAVGVAVLVLALLPNKDESSFARQRTDQEEIVRRVDELTEAMDDLQVGRADDKKEIKLRMADHFTNVDRRVSDVSGQQVESKRSHGLASAAASEEIERLRQQVAALESKLNVVDGDSIMREG